MISSSLGASYGCFKISLRPRMKVHCTPIVVARLPATLSVMSVCARHYREHTSVWFRKHQRKARYAKAGEYFFPFKYDQARVSVVFPPMFSLPLPLRRGVLQKRQTPGASSSPQTGRPKRRNRDRRKTFDDVHAKQQ